MATVAHTKTTLNRNLTGINLTDATYQTLVAGAGNGADFELLPSDIIILRNDTGSDAVYLFIIPPSASITAVGGSITSPVLNLTTGKILALRVSDVFKHSTTFKCTIECSGAGKLLVLHCP